MSDEATGVSGRIGAKGAMIPVTVNVLWKKDNRRQAYRYQIVHSRRLTPLAIRYCIKDAATGWHELPELHAVRYGVEIDFGKLGTYRAANISSGSDIDEVVSDAVRPVTALLRNPYGQAVEPAGVKVDLTIDEGMPVARILRLNVGGRIYRPGDIVEGTVTVRPFRQEDTKLPFSLKLPDDLPEGQYALSASDAMHSMTNLQGRMPHRFSPRSVQELFDALGFVVSGQADDLYLTLPLTTGGVALGQKELPDLPDSKARLIREAALPEARQFTETLIRTQPSPYVLGGQASATITVQDLPQKTLLRP
jgi:ribosomal protein S28E/S33